MEWIAISAGLIYTLGCWLWGGRFPFYKFELYAAAGGRTEGAVPIFLADDKECPIWKYTGFSGFDDRTFDYSGVPTSVQWMVEEAARWVKEHPLADREEGPVHVAFGFRYLKVGEDGRIEQRILIQGRGRAWML